MAAGVATPAVDLGSDGTRNYHDERVVHKSSMLYFNDLVDPGWRDPDFSSSNHSFVFFFPQRMVNTNRSLLIVPAVRAVL